MLRKVLGIMFFIAGFIAAALGALLVVIAGDMFARSGKFYGDIPVFVTFNKYMMYFQYVVLFAVIAIVFFYAGRE